MEARLIRQLREGDAEAGRQFARDYYPDVYRYLLYLTGRPEMAEDLAQQTFLHAWRRLDRFEGRASLRVWLHRIAHREFLQALRSQRPHASLEEVAEEVPARGPEWLEAIELREAIRQLPGAERDVIVLHYLHGYNCTEISAITGAPVTTVKYRLMMARASLQRALGEGDLSYLNEPGLTMRHWAWLPLEALTTLEARLPFVERREGTTERPTAAGRPASALSTEVKGVQTMNDKNHAGISRRKLLEAAGTAPAAAATGLAGPIAAAASPNEAEIIDSRLARRVSLSFKATALSDVCDHLRAESGVHLAAGPSVADEKVSLFCEHTPLREVMRQMSRPFGYTWLRSHLAGSARFAGTRSGVQALGKDSVDLNARTPERLNADYRYELVQDLRSQLLEEELRNRDRNAALLALDREMQRYRPYLELTPDEALARARTADPDEQPLLERMAGKTWGAIRMYFRLTPTDMAALWAGRPIKFSVDPQPGDQSLPPDMAQGVLESWRDWRIRRHEDQFDVDTEKELPDGQLPVSVPEARAGVTFRLDHSELGQFTLMGGSGMNIAGRVSFIDDELATGVSPAIRDLENAAVHARQARDPDLQRPVTVNLDASRQTPDAAGEPLASTIPGAASPRLRSKIQNPKSKIEKVTTADVLEALHRASGLPIIADYYTHLYSPSDLVVRDRPLFDALNLLADAMRLRWNKDEAWLQFRSASFFNDRLKEVPNRLLARWSTSRRQHGALTLDDLLEIAQLSDAQLDSASMAEGARDGWGLAEWDLARNTCGLRPTSATWRL